MIYNLCQGDIQMEMFAKTLPVDGTLRRKHGDKLSFLCLISYTEKKKFFFFFELVNVMFVLLAQIRVGINLRFGIGSMRAIKPLR